MSGEVYTRFPGPVLLLAGPGTGKTHSLALRVKWLIEQKGVSPDEITVMTFTREAARNMRERLSDSEKPDVNLHEDDQPAVISTMHSLGHRIISECAKQFGLDGKFRLVASDAVRRILFGDAAQLSDATRADGEEAERVKRCGSAEACSEALGGIIRKYDCLLRSCDAIDYDDQILLAYRALRQDEGLLRQYQGRAKHLLVDEYQDINAGQFELIKLLSGAHPQGLFVVGDDDQSIYSFRGGSPDYIRNFRDHFGESAHVEDLHLSRRCRENVLKCGLAVVREFSRGRVEKHEARFLHEEKGLVRVYHVPSEKKEAQMIAAIASAAIPSRDVLILVPNALFASHICQSLRRARIGFSFRPALDEGGFAAFEALRDWLATPADDLALRSLLQKLVDAGTTGVPSAKCRTEVKLDEREKALLSIARLWLPVLGNGTAMYDALTTAAEEGGQSRALFDRLNELQEAHNNSLEVFAECACRLLQPWRKPANMLDDVSRWLREAREASKAGNDGGIRIMTMHSAKGLEADIAIIVGLEENVFPRNDDANIDEKARQLFVSMTRAKRELHLFHARTRSASATYMGRPHQLKASPFLRAIPDGLTETCYVPGPADRKRAKTVTP